MSVKEHVKFVGTGWFYGVMVFAFIIAATFGTLYFKPAFLGMERKAYVASHQYVEARKTEVLKYIEQHNELEVQILFAESSENLKMADALRTQQESLAAKIRSAVAKMPANQMPTEAHKFLR